MAQLCRTQHLMVFTGNSPHASWKITSPTWPFGEEVPTTGDRLNSEFLEASKLFMSERRRQIWLCWCQASVLVLGWWQPHLQGDSGSAAPEGGLHAARSLLYLIILSLQKPTTLVLSPPYTPKIITRSPFIVFLSYITAAGSFPIELGKYTCSLDDRKGKK